MKALLSVILLNILFACSCSSGNAPQFTSTHILSAQSAITVAISPSSALVQVGQSRQFIAAVSGTSNSAVQWSVSGAPGGNSTVGIVSISGVYTAPSSKPTVPVTVTATSSEDTTQFSSASVSVDDQTASPVSVVVSPASVTLNAGQNQQFTATVSGTSNTAVQWSLVGGQSGSVIGVITSSGLYTAPASSPGGPITITATSAYDITKSASAQATVVTQPVSNGINYYLSPNGNDSNDGSLGNSWKTIGRADAAAAPGVTIHLEPGTYSNTAEKLGEIKTTKSGAANAHILYISDVKWGAEITSNQTGNSAVWWNRGDYVDIEGFEMTGSGALGIYNEGSFTRIIANNIHDIPAPGCPDFGGAGIDDGNFNASDDDIIGNWVHDIGDVNVACQRVHGIYHANLRGHVYNNVTFRNQGWGIHLWHSANQVTVANNTVFNNGYGGILIGADLVSNDNTLVINNAVFKNGFRADAQGYGIEEFGSVGPNNRYLNNLVFQNGPADFNLPGKTPLNTVSADPQFVNYVPDGSGDYHLQATSPAMDAGSSTGAPTTDYDGGLRPVGSGWDIGAYELGSIPGPYPY